MKTLANIIEFTTVLSELVVKGIKRRFYRAVPRHRETLHKEDIISRTAERTGVDAGLLSYYVTVLFDVIIEAVKSGHRVLIEGFAEFLLTVRGLFAAANDPWDPTRHRLALNVVAKGNLKEAASGMTGKNMTQGNNVILKRVTDTVSGVENVLTNQPNLEVIISGDNLLMKPGSEDEGVWLENAAGEIVAESVVTDSAATTVDCTFATLPEDGEYTLVVAARGTYDANYGVSVARRKVAVKTANE